MEIKDSRKITFNEDIKNALEVLRQGGIILYPTDTIWGIGCDARNEDAVKRIFRLKNRSDSKSMISLVGSEVMLERTVDDIPEVAWQLIEVAVDPLTIVYDHPKGLAPSLLAPDGSAGIRITRERFSRELVNRLRAPLVSTSANISGATPPQSFHDISSDILEGVDYVVCFGRDEDKPRTPSAVIKISDGGVVKILR